MWTLLLNNRITRAIGGLLAAIAAVWVYGLTQRRKGRQDAMQEAKTHDQERALDIRKRADDARRLHDDSDLQFRD